MLVFSHRLAPKRSFRAGTKDTRIDAYLDEFRRATARARARGVSAQQIILDSQRWALEPPPALSSVDLPVGSARRAVRGRVRGKGQCVLTLTGTRRRSAR